MKILCGNDVLVPSQIESVQLRRITTDELTMLEKEQNGEYVSSNSVLSASLLNDFSSLFVDFTEHICRLLPVPQLKKSDLDLYAGKHKELEKIEYWEIQWLAGELLLLSSFDENGDAKVRWSFKIWNPHDDDAIATITWTYRTIMLSQVITALKELIDLPKPKNAWASFLAGYSYKKIQRYILPVYNEYMRGKKVIEVRNKAKESFIERNKRKNKLCISLLGETATLDYIEDYCGFDIFEKEKEIQMYLQQRGSANL